MLTKEEISEIKRRAGQAYRKHGVRALEVRGVDSLDEAGRSRLIELMELTQTKAGVVSLLMERAAKAELIVELAESWVQKEVESGKKFDDIGLLRRLGTYQETARRALTALLAALPKDGGAKDITDLLGGDNESD
jgi:ABC-type transporter Mla MlaB component